jgi:hypothetical protein
MDNISQAEDFDQLIRSFINIGNRMEHEEMTKSNESFYNAEGLGKKILHHIITSRFLINGYQLNEFYPQVDFASIAVFTRAALETYLTFNYLFVAPKNVDEKEFKLQAWYLGGLDRIKFEPAFVDNIRKFKDEFQQASPNKDKD